MKKTFISDFLKSLKKKTQSISKSKEVESSEEPDVQDKDFQVIEHHEVLYSDRPNKVMSTPSSDQKIPFADVDKVESDIDSIDEKKSVEKGTVEQKVDYILSKKKHVHKKTPHHRKPANIIYVVSKPQPGQVKGDWAVRSHRKIFSHHRTKQAAISNARSIALEKDATVLVQNMDGTFSNGFKPRKKN